MSRFCHKKKTVSFTDVTNDNDMDEIIAKKVAHQVGTISQRCRSPRIALLLEELELLFLEMFNLLLAGAFGSHLKPQTKRLAPNITQALFLPLIIFFKVTTNNFIIRTNNCTDIRTNLPHTVKCRDILGLINLNPVFAHIFGRIHCDICVMY